MVKPLTALDDNGAGAEIKHVNHKSNVRSVENLRAVRQQLRPQLGCGMQRNGIAAAAARLDLGNEKTSGNHET